MMNSKVKYFVDFPTGRPGWIELKTVDDHNIVWEGRESAIPGYEDNWQDALDKFFEANLNITPDEWEVG